MDDLISKKELLKVCNISYGQLYRWKRKQLIPEEWFIRKSTFTGQEAFFPRQQILQRIEQIKSLKDDYALDELVHIFNSADEEVAVESVPFNVPDYLAEYMGASFDRDHITEQQSMILTLIDEALKTGQVTKDELSAAVDVLTDTALESGQQYVFIRKMGVSLFAVVTGDCKFEGQAVIVFQMTYDTLRTQLKVSTLRG